MGSVRNVPGLPRRDFAERIRAYGHWLSTAAVPAMFGIGPDPKLADEASPGIAALGTGLCGTFDLSLVRP